MAIILTDAELDDLYERSKLAADDNLVIDIRVLVAEIRDHRQDVEGLRRLFALRRAADQMAIANWHGAHPGNDLIIPNHGDLVIWLLDQLATERRLERVDTSLARQLGQSIERNAKLHERIAEIRLHIEHWLAAYPLDIFPEPDLKKAAELLKAGGMTLDGISADMARHVLKRLIEFIDHPEEKL